MNKIIFLFLTASSAGTMHAMDIHRSYYERFRAAYIQSAEESRIKIWSELTKLTIQERDKYIASLLQQAKEQGDIGIYNIFERVCKYCMAYDSKTKYDSYCRCETQMCEPCFKALMQCPRCNVRL